MPYKYSEKQKEHNKKYYQEHKEEILKQQKEYHQEYLQKRKQYRKKYNKEHREERQNYANNQLKLNINYRLSRNLRTRIRCALKGICKSESTKQLLSCSIDLFRLYLQSKFKPRMSFINYGLWHIDHIIPCARFDLTKLEEQKKCFNYTNLQPLWAIENKIKGSRWIKPIIDQIGQMEEGHCRTTTL